MTTEPSLSFELMKTTMMIPAILHIQEEMAELWGMRCTMMACYDA